VSWHIHDSIECSTHQGNSIATNFIAVGVRNLSIYSSFLNNSEKLQLCSTSSGTITHGTIQTGVTTVSTPSSSTVFELNKSRGWASFGSFTCVGCIKRKGECCYTSISVWFRCYESTRSWNSNSQSGISFQSNSINLEVKLLVYLWSVEWELSLARKSGVSFIFLCQE
jgi:hypothetical protein